MQFSKQSRKYINKELSHGISNYFTFSIKSLEQSSVKIQEMPLCCSNCKFPKTHTRQEFCVNCQHKYPLIQSEEKPEPKVNPLKKIKVNDPDQEPKVEIPVPLGEHEVPKNYHFNEPLKQEKTVTKAMFLCIDMSGSMCISYPSKYKKINKEFVSKILGQENFQALSKLGEQKIISNYQIFQTLLRDGQTPRNIIEMFKQEASRDQKISEENKGDKNKSNKEEITDHITRKQIVGAIVNKYIEILKNREPETHFTLLYFNNDIEIPVLGFNEKQTICGIQKKSVEEMVKLGQVYGEKISINKAENIGQNVVKNYIEANQNGQTAMTPALAFCIGLAKSIGHSLNQIIVVTDGLSNIGIGQTQDEFQREDTSRLFEHLALKYAKPSNCVVNFMTFQDCSIGYDILDQIVGITGGTATCISFAEHGGEKIVTDQTISLMTLNLIEGFFASTQRLCYNTQIMIGCNNKKIKLNLPLQLRPFIIKNYDNKILLSLGIKSPKYIFKVYFEYLQSAQKDKEKMLQMKEQQTQKQQNVIDEFADKNVIFTVLSKFNRKKKQHTFLQSQRIYVNKGSEQQTYKEQAKILSKEIDKKLKVYQIFEEQISEYNQLQSKLQKNSAILKEMDPELVKKFELKKQKLQEFNANTDRLTKDQMSMKSRTYKTYKQRDKDEDSEDDGFS